MITRDEIQTLWEKQRSEKPRQSSGMTERHRADYLNLYELAVTWYDMPYQGHWCKWMKLLAEYIRAMEGGAGYRLDEYPNPALYESIHEKELLAEGMISETQLLTPFNRRFLARLKMNQGIVPGRNGYIEMAPKDHRYRLVVVESSKNVDMIWVSEDRSEWIREPEEPIVIATHGGKIVYQMYRQFVG